MQKIQVKRAYEAPSADDGYRVYIDKLWPRGFSHAEFPYNSWDKSIAPSTELREWFHQAPDERWPEFEKRYRDELNANPALASLREEIADKPVVTLLYSSHDGQHNNAIVLRSVLQQ